MERQQTDNLLKSHASGTYLIRERPAEAERFAISIKYVEAGAQRDPPLMPFRAKEPTSPPDSGLVGCGLGMRCPRQGTLEMQGRRRVCTMHLARDKRE